MKVLIVDDYIMFREGIVTLLSKEPDFEVVGEAGTAAEAVEKSLTLEPDLILIDISLPDGSGIKAIETIVSERPGIDIVVLTYHETEQLMLEAIRAGAKGYILKKIPVAKLITLLRGLQRGELPLSRTMTSHVIEELYRLGKKNENKDPSKLDVISRREREVLTLLSGDASNEEIAEKLSLSVHTVKKHVSSILYKLHLKNRYQAGNYARRSGRSNSNSNSNSSSEDH